MGLDMEHIGLDVGTDMGAGRGGWRLGFASELEMGLIIGMGQKLRI